MGFEPMAFSLARRRSTAELRPQTALEGYLDRGGMSRFYDLEYALSIIHVMEGSVRSACGEFYD
jgi:hypothetical protein